MNSGMKSSLIIILCYIIFLHFVENSTSMKHTAFISNLAVSKFSKCTLFIIGENYDTENNKIGSNFESTVSQIALELGYSFIPLRTSGLSTATNQTEKTAFLRNSPNCKLVVAVLTTQSEAFLTTLERRFSPPYIPTLRKDKDFWIFLTRSTNLERLLLSNALPSRIKYKVGIGLEPGDQVLLKSVCFFCGVNGSPFIVEMHLTSSSFRLSQVFPDYVENLNGKLLTISTPSIRSFLDFDPRVAVNNAKRGTHYSIGENNVEPFCIFRSMETTFARVSHGDA